VYLSSEHGEIRRATDSGVPMQRDLVERAMVGDREASTELGRLWIDRLYAIARLILRDGERAQDATQEALLAAWRDLRGLRDPDRFEPWLPRLLVNACYREARRKQRHTRLAALVPTIEHVPIHRGALADRDELMATFEALTPEQRALIVLHYYVGLPMSETALALGLPVGTVKSRLFRTTQQMRATLDADARVSLTERRAT
jgi:RNA polymerase sigma-70 factor (ECF subfamily)